MDKIQMLTILFPAFLLALCFHEFAHAWMAKQCGDDTAERMGRLTLNPIAHADLVGTVILPLFAILSGVPLFFGWAKPVPVNESRLRKPKEHMFWVALAGPLSNVLLALIAVPFYVYSQKYDSVAIPQFLQIFISINVILAVFNLFPLHPLDGGKILARFLPYEANRALENIPPMMTFVVLMGLIYTGVFRILFLWALAPLEALAQLLTRLFF